MVYITVLNIIFKGVLILKRTKLIIFVFLITIMVIGLWPWVGTNRANNPSSDEPPSPLTREQVQAYYDSSFWPSGKYSKQLDNLFVATRDYSPGKEEELVEALQTVSSTYKQIKIDFLAITPASPELKKIHSKDLKSMEYFEKALANLEEFLMHKNSSQLAEAKTNINEAYTWTKSATKDFSKILDQYRVGIGDK
jgi:hypothetical protein